MYPTKPATLQRCICALKKLCEADPLTMLILVTDTDIIIQIPAVFVKTTKAKSQKSGKICIKASRGACFTYKTSMSRSFALSVSPSMPGKKRAAVNVKKQQEYPVGVGRGAMLNAVHCTDRCSTVMSMGKFILEQSHAADR